MIGADMADTDPVRHAFTAGQQTQQDTAGAPPDHTPPISAAMPADKVGMVGTVGPTTQHPRAGTDDDDLAERLRVDPDRGDVKG
jgi:hypothetical protein